ncbi:MAG: helix-hairpin-helix domain-containing protein [Phycisphaeraceae bacterium]
MSISLPPTRRRASVLLLAMAVLMVLTSMALTFSRGMRVESSAAEFYVAQLQADAIARGAAEYVRSLVSNTNGTLPADEEIEAEAVPLGDGYFWLIRSDPQDDRAWAFGLTDEAGKLNINTATVDMLAALPGMNDDLAAGIVDWRDPDEEAQAGGAESQYYLLLDDPTGGGAGGYQAKNDAVETVEELLLVKDITPAVLFGEDTNRNGVLDANEDDADTTEPADNRDGVLDHGICPFVTVYSREPAGSGGGGGGSGQGNTPTTGRINVNTAPREVLLCLPGLDEADVQAILSARGAATTTYSDVNAFLATLPPNKQAELVGRITVDSYVCSADIVAVAASGKAFKRYRVVFDATTSPARIVYWQDMTNLGWPLDPQVLENLRSGNAGSMQ